ncbi:MAG: undecaprenyl-phosphate glucose phosphotransferase [Phycisphaerales bacterium JB037]
MLKQRHQLFVVLTVVADGFVVAAACLLAWVTRRLWIDGTWPDAWASYIKEPLVLLSVPTVLGVLWMMGLYRPRRDRSILPEVGQVFKASIVSLLALVAILWSIGDGVLGARGVAPVTRFGVELDPARTQLGVLALALPVGISAFRVCLRMGLRYLRVRGKNLRHVAIIGVGRLGQIAGRTLSRNSWTGIQVSYFIAHEPAADRETCLGKPVLGGLDDLERVLEEHRVDAIYLALPNAEAAQIPQVLKRLERFALDVRIIPDVPLRYLPQSMAVSELEGMPVLSYRESPLYGLGGLSKRALDIAGAAAALILFSPLMLAIAILVRLSGPGPVIFRQPRVTLGDEQFQIYKFRTMFHVADESAPRFEDDDATPDDPTPAQSPEWTRRDDPRITRIGRFLRRTSLDELPQLINVIKGDMSLVGPRPERPELIERFREDWRGYMLRQHVKAGMTGWAQVNGLRGDTDLRKRIQHDLFYVRHWSLGFDLKILWLTLFRGFVHRNAH